MEWSCESKEDFLEHLGLAGVAVPIDEGSGDARVMKVFFRAGDGRRGHTWGSVCNEVSAVHLEDFAKAGPRTAAWCIALLRRQQMYPEDYNLTCTSRHKLGPNDWGGAQHQPWQVAPTSWICRTSAALSTSSARPR